LSASTVGIFANVLPLLLTLNPFGGQTGVGRGATFDVAFGFGFFLTFGLVVGFFVTLGFAGGFFVAVGFAVGFFVTVGFAVGFFVGAGELVTAWDGNTAAGIINEKIKNAKNMRLITIPLKLSN
jgi:hypothetical protein